ncbi:MAG TPA: sulfatase-like hydrolase/transferase, partial [Tepidisphaeraceae bacterium]|nr:sulfatase-like hydrolase/transferase [Tepidisphaeraceae bacterium]
MRKSHLLFFALIVWATLATSSALAQSAATTAPSRPNILWIMADQFRADCLGANGNRIIRTPNLDRLASSSANFTNAFVQSPVCVPSRASYFTGRYPHSHRNRVNYTPLKADEILLPRRLQGFGYQTALVGKTHLYYDYPPTREAAQRTGFDLVDLHDGVSGTDPYSDYVTWRNQNDPQRKLYYRRLARTVPELMHDLPPDGNPDRSAIDARFTETAWTGLRTRERLKEFAANGKPFFLFSSYWKPHGPYDVPAPYDSMYNNVDIPLPPAETIESIQTLPLPVQKLILRGPKLEFKTDRGQLEWNYRSYYGTITQVDADIGLTLDALKELGLDKNTIVVFCSDHGDQLLEHGLFGKNVFFESSEHVPLIVGYPGHV